MQTLLGWVAAATLLPASKYGIGLWQITANKVKTTDYFDEYVLRKAQSTGLNVSKVAENALIVAIRRLKGSTNEILVRGVGFEPTNPYGIGA